MVRLKLKHLDNLIPNYLLVIDEETGKEVGYIQSGNSDGIEISLFDGKYRTRVNRCETAVGFVLASNRSSITWHPKICFGGGLAV